MLKTEWEGHTSLLRIIQILPPQYPPRILLMRLANPRIRQRALRVLVDEEVWDPQLLALGTRPVAHLGLHPADLAFVVVQQDRRAGGAWRAGGRRGLVGVVVHPFDHRHAVVAVVARGEALVR